MSATINLSFHGLVLFPHSEKVDYPWENFLMIFTWRSIAYRHCSVHKIRFISQDSKNPQSKILFILILLLNSTIMHRYPEMKSGQHPELLFFDLELKQSMFMSVLYSSLFLSHYHQPQFLLYLLCCLYLLWLQHQFYSLCCLLISLSKTVTWWCFFCVSDPSKSPLFPQDKEHMTKLVIQDHEIFQSSTFLFFLNFSWGLPSKNDKPSEFLEKDHPISHHQAWLLI